ncbi:MAG TPA: DAK2 domain-containing protein [Dermatophilaceae bacterium]|nr:DAK2 domain-containing protein [Dermatophilaceae bacterium]
MPDALTADDARHWTVLARAALAARRTEIDALNVFPVPDGDTGTNLYLTMDAAIDEVVAAHERAGTAGPPTLRQECRMLARAMLLSARGNSGVITSQLVGGVCEVVLEEDVDVVDGACLARAITRGAELARASVAHPQEGTILTVADAAAAASRAAAEEGGGVTEVTGAAVTAAQAALERTPEQLPALARAGVVDAGGAGCVLLLESLHRALTGSWSRRSGELLSAGPPLQRREEWHVRGVLPAAGGHDLGAGPDLEEDGPAYEVMYLLEESDAARVSALRETLDGLGDSLLLVGGPDLWNVHVHVDDAGAAVEAGIEAGRPRRIRVTALRPEAERRRRPVDEVGVVACAAGPGIAALLEGAGAVVVPSAPGARASAGQLLEAVLRTGAGGVVLLPNDGDTLLAAEGAAKAAREEGVATLVVPARTAVQGIAALAVHDAARPLEEDALAMTAAAVATRHGAVTVAVKEALTWAGACRPGDVLGVVDGDVALLGEDLAATAGAVLDRLLAPGGELVTLVSGADAEPALVAGVAAGLQRSHPEVEVVVLDGGQPTYPLLIGVE